MKLVLRFARGIGVAINTHGHAIKGAGAALEHKRREILLVQSIRELIRVLFLFHSAYLNHETRGVRRKRAGSAGDLSWRGFRNCNRIRGWNLRRLLGGPDVSKLPMIAGCAHI